MGNIKDKYIIQDLAYQVYQASLSKENQERRQVWTDSNSLRNGNRIPVFCELYDTWDEVLPRDSLITSDPFMQEMEYTLKQILYKYALGDDDVVEPWFPVEVISNLGKDRGVSLWGYSMKRQSSDSRGWVYQDHPVQNESDLDRIESPELRYDKAATQEKIARVEDVLEGILPAKPTLGMANRQWAKLHSWATALCGMENLYIYMIDKPEFVHSLMRTMMEGMLSLMDQCEEEGILCLNNVDRHSCDSLPAEDFDGANVRFIDIWGRGESQEFDGLSPDMFNDFLLQYQRPILERFGIINYGCCESLTNKIEYVMQIPNLRQFICSAWTDLEKTINLLGDRYAIERRQSASDIISADSVHQLKDKFVKDLEIARGCHMQILLDSVMTLGDKPNRLKEWVVWAKDLASRY